MSVRPTFPGHAFPFGTHVYREPDTVSPEGFIGARDLLGDALAAPSQGSVTVTVPAAALRCFLLSH